jgi:hypothetical protein
MLIQSIPIAWRACSTVKTSRTSLRMRLACAVLPVTLTVRRFVLSTGVWPHTVKAFRLQTLRILLSSGPEPVTVNVVVPATGHPLPVMLIAVRRADRWSIGAAIVFGAFEILRSDPHDAFPLLVAWGPKAIGSIIALYVVYDLAKIVLNLVGRAIHAFEKMGAGLQKIGDKDDRAVQEMQTLTAVTAQRSEKTHTMLQGYHEANVAWGARMEGKLDKAIEEWKKP